MSGSPLKQLRQALRDGRQPDAAATAPAPVPAWPAPAPLFAPVQFKTDPAAGTPARALPPPHLNDQTRSAHLTQVEVQAPLLAASLHRLDPWQQAAVLDDSAALLVRAQVGSGKTAVLSHKVLYLLACGGVPLQQMAVVTFTNKAAAELRLRLLSLQPGLSHQELQQVGTFHGLARHLLAHRLPLHQLGLRPGFAIVDEAGNEQLLRELIRSHKLTIKHPAKLLARLSKLRRSGGVKHGQMREEDDLVTLHELAVQARRQRNVVDFDDLLDGATALLLAAPLDPPLQWLLVDEAQDCEPRELALLDALCGPQTRRFAVGDPLQSIYAWRGSAATTLTELADRWQAQVVQLPQNYRSTQTILDAARAVLGRQPDAAGPLVAVRGAGQPICVLRHHNTQLEGLFLAEHMRAGVAAGGRLGDWGVLVRTRRQAETLVGVLRTAGVAARLGARSDWERQPAVRWVRSALQLAWNPQDASEVQTLLTDPQLGLLARKQWPARSWQALLDSQPTGDLRLIVADWLDTPPTAAKNARNTGAKAATAIAAKAARDTAGMDRRDRQWAAAWLRRLAHLPALLDETAEPLDDLVWRGMQLDEVLRPTSAQYDDRVALVRRWLAALGHGWQHWQHGLGDQRLIPSLALPQLLALAELGGLPALQDQQAAIDRGSSEDDAVAVLTLHASKGLEFRHVVISGCNEGLLPLRSSRTAGTATQEDPAAEERRLFYVGLTRARDTVQLSWHGQPALPQAQPEPSALLYAIPAHLWTEALPAPLVPVAAVPQAVQTPDTPDPAFDSALAMADQPVSAAGAFAVGEGVRHARYGQGEVTAITADEVTARFGKLGTKTFALLLCPLTKLSA